MPAGLPELPLTIRVFYLRNSVEGNPFWNEWSGGLGLSAFGTAESAEEILEQIVSDAAIVFLRAGIRLQLHRDGIQPLDNPTLDSSDRGLLEDVWAQGQPWVNVIWVRQFDRRTSGSAYYPVPEEELLACGVLMATFLNASTPIGGGNIVLVQELAHILGLTHTAKQLEEDKPGSWSPSGGDYLISVDAMHPFTDDTAGLNEEDELANPMSYDWDPTEKLDPADFRWTRNQILRMRLTLVARHQDVAYLYWRYTREEHLSGVTEEGLVALERIWPDFPGPIAASWLT